MERKWWTLLATCVAVFMLLLDITIVNVALPDIQQSLDASFSDLQWVVDAYALSLASLLLTAGSLGDRLGRRSVFVAGFAIFTLASLLCGLAGDPTFLNLMRALQGVGGAAMFATTLALIAQEFQGPRARDRVRHLGRDRRRRRRDRPAGRRRAHRGLRLGVDLLRQRPDRDRGDRADPDEGRRVARAGPRAGRLGRRRRSSPPRCSCSSSALVRGNAEGWASGRSSAR